MKTDQGDTNKTVSTIVNKDKKLEGYRPVPSSLSAAKNPKAPIDFRKGVSNLLKSNENGAQSDVLKDNSNVAKGTTAPKNKRSSSVVAVTENNDTSMSSNRIPKSRDLSRESSKRFGVLRGNSKSKIDSGSVVRQVFRIRPESSG